MVTNFKISGKERRALKNELGRLKSVVRNFWHFHALDKDMYAILGLDDSGMMSDEEAERVLNKHKARIEKMELLLQEKN